MPLYQFNDPASTIKQIEFRKHGKQMEAFVYAPEGAAAESLSAIPAMLQKKELTVSPQIVEGKQVLRVTGFKDAGQLLAPLRESAAIAGTGAQSITEWDKAQPKLSFTEKIKENSLQLSGLAYTAGNIAIMGSGLARKDYAEIGTASAWAFADGLLAAYGRDSKDEQANKMVDKLRDYLIKEGVEIPKGTALTPEELAKPEGVVDKTMKFLKDHRVDIKNAMEVVGGGLYFKAGLNQHNPFKAAAGACIVTGFLTALLVQEKGADEKTQAANGDALAEKLAGNHGHEKEKLGDKAKNWIQEKPLRFTGALALTHNALTLTGAYREKIKNSKPEVRQGLVDTLSKDTAALTAYETQMKAKPGLMPERGLQSLKEAEAKSAAAITHFDKHKNDFRWNVAQSSCMVVANALYGLSSKNPIDEKQERELQDDVCAVAASIVAAQPKEVRDHMVDKVAAFCATQKMMHMKTEDIAQTIHQKIDALTQSPWLNKVQHSKNTSAEMSLST